jgi:hypothetical protein
LIDNYCIMNYIKIDLRILYETTTTLRFENALLACSLKCGFFHRYCITISEKTCIIKMNYVPANSCRREGFLAGRVVEAVWDPTRAAAEADFVR